MVKHRRKLSHKKKFKKKSYSVNSDCILSTYDIFFKILISGNK